MDTIHTVWTPALKVYAVSFPLWTCEPYRSSLCAECGYCRRAARRAQWAAPSRSHCPSVDWERNASLLRGPGIATLYRTADKINALNRRPTRDGRFLRWAKLGEALFSVSSAWSLGALARATLDTTHSIPTKAWRDVEHWRRIRATGLLDRPNVRVLLSIDSSMPQTEIYRAARLVRRDQVGTMFFGAKNPGHPFLRIRRAEGALGEDAPGIHVRCLKTWAGGHCRKCRHCYKGARALPRHVELKIH